MLVALADVATGEVMWDHPGFGHAPLMAADGKLILLSDHCELLIADASPAGFKSLSRFQVLGGETSACPVLCNGRIYCRNKAGELVCLDVRADALIIRAEDAMAIVSVHAGYERQRGPGFCARPDPGPRCRSYPA